MPPYASIESSFANFHLGSHEDTVLTVLDLPEDNASIDIGQLSFQDVERMKVSDPFMYASIEQELRKRKYCTFDSDQDDVRGPEAPDAAAGFSLKVTINEETETIQSSTQGSPTQAADPQQRVSSSARRQPRGMSQSLRVPPRSSASNQRRYSTGRVTRKRRVSTETYYDEDIMELAASIRSSLTSTEVDAVLRIDQNNNKGEVNTDGLNFSFLE
jgi:hypothetical protein